MGIKDFPAGFLGKWCGILKSVAGDDIFAKTKKDAMIASPHVIL